MDPLVAGPPGVITVIATVWSCELGANGGVQTSRLEALLTVKHGALPGGVPVVHGLWLTPLTSAWIRDEPKSTSVVEKPGPEKPVPVMVTWSPPEVEPVVGLTLVKVGTGA